MDYIERTLKTFRETHRALFIEIRNEHGNKELVDVTDWVNESLSDALTGLLGEMRGKVRKEKKRMSTMLNAYAQFEADVMDGIKPEVAQKNLLKVLTTKGI